MSKTETKINELRDLQTKANALEKEATKAANDLGLKEGDLPGFSEVQDYSSDADDIIFDLQDSLAAMDKIIMNL